MAWNDDSQGPWGRPPGGGSPRPPGNNRPTPGGSGPPDPGELFRKAQERFNHFFSGPGGNKQLLLAVVSVVGFLWMASGVYQVQAGEIGVVLRFGQVSRIVQAGLRYHLPAPFESAYVVNTQLVRKESFGGNPDAQAGGGGNLMLTGDENIIDISFDVQWDIKDPQKFLFRVADQKDTVRNVAESAMREIIGQTAFTVAQTAGKSKIEQDTKVLIQKTLDSYDVGIRILTVNLLESSAPGPVVEAVRDVQAARADEERSRNEAESYRNDIIPRARGKAEMMMQEAQAYKQEVVAHAQGDVARFNFVYEQYSKAQDVTRKRMYLETMEKVLGGMNKVILGNKSAVPYFPLPSLQTPADKKEDSK